jgi:dolichol kinase
MAETTLDPFDELVEQTRGLQPWRKVFHACNAVLIAAALVTLGLTRTESAAILGVVAALLVIGDSVRLMNRGANELFFRVFRTLASPREAEGIASSTWYTIGIFAAVALVPRQEAVSAILVLGLADPIASVVGQTLGRRPFMGGSVEGTATFLTVALLVLLPRHAWPVAVAAALLATISERRSWPLDDNFAVPVVTALVLYWGGLLL